MTWTMPEKSSLDLCSLCIRNPPQASGWSDPADYPVLGLFHDPKQPMGPVCELAPRGLRDGFGPCGRPRGLRLGGVARVCWFSSFAPTDSGYKALAHGVLKSLRRCVSRSMDELGRNSGPVSSQHPKEVCFKSVSDGGVGRGAKRTSKCPGALVISEWRTPQKTKDRETTDTYH